MMALGVGELVVIMLIAGSLSVVAARAAWQALVEFPSPYEGPTLRASPLEVTRLATAHAVLGGSSFRRKVIERARDRHHAAAIEMGIDYDLLLRVCLWMERREIRYDLTLSTGFALLVALSMARVPFASLFWLALAGVVLAKRYEERFVLARHFRREAFTRDKILACFNTSLPAALAPGIPRAVQNVCVYQGFNPFDAAGVETAGWSFVVDASRPKDGGSLDSLAPVHVTSLLAAIEHAATSLHVSGVESRDVLFVRGSDLAGLPAAMPNRFGTPETQIDPRYVQGLVNELDDRVRHYKWISIGDWGSELVISSFVHVSLFGSQLFLQCRHYLLTPLAPKYRLVETLTNDTWWTMLRWSVFRLVLVPLDVVASVIWACYRPIAAIPRVIGLQEWWSEVLIADQPFYNHGTTSLRQQMAGTQFKHYFQKTDCEMLQKLIDKRVLDSIVSFLDVHGIDTSDIKERTAMIFNSGIIVQGGDVNAGNLAVGKGSRASNFLSRLRRRPTQASAR